jgi:DnaK suppressor protein
MDKITNTKLREEIAALGQDDEYMSDAQVTIFQKYLREELRALSAKQSNHIGVHAEINERVSDPADMATKSENQVYAMSDDARLDNSIKQIKAALELIRLGDYGFCASCGGEIGLERLFTIPHAVRDAECANVFELKEKQLLGRSTANIKIP